MREIPNNSHLSPPISGSIGKYGSFSQTRQTPQLLSCLVITLLCLIGSVELGAKERTARFSHLNESNGLPYGGVMSLAEDNMGYVWFGTQSGLFQFDGYELSAVTSSESVQKLILLGQGRFAAATPHGLQDHQEFLGESRFIGETPEAVHALALEGQDKATAVLFGTKDGLHRWDFANDQTAPLWSGGNVISIVTHDSDIWFGTRRGDLWRWNPDQAEAPLLWWRCAAPISAILRDSRGALWIGTKGLGLYRLNGREVEARFTHEQTPYDSLPSNDIRCLYQDSQEQLWIGTPSGLGCLAPHDETIRLYQETLSDPSSLGGNEIHCIYEDRRQVLWVGHEHGVSRFGLNQRWFVTEQHRPGDEQSLVHDAVYGMTATKDGHLWVGTAGGISRYDVSQESMRHRPLTPPLSTIELNVSALKHTPEDVLWIGTRDRGLLRWKESSNEIHHFPHEPNVNGSLPHDGVTALASDQTQQLWIGTHAGLARWDGGPQFHTYEEEIGQASITDVHVDPGNRVWVALANRGLRIFDQQTNAWQPLGEVFENQTVTVIAQSQGESVWLGTKRNGIYQFHPDRGILAHYHRRNSSLPDNTIHGILLDFQGKLWVSTSNGLCRQQVNGAFRIFDTGDGLASKMFHPKAFCQDHLGRLHFGGNRGFTTIDLETLPNSRAAQQAILTNLEINGEKIQPGPDNAILKKPLAMTKMLKLPFGEWTRVALGFGTLDYTNPVKSHFRFRMLPLETEWVTSAEERRAVYTGLGVGDYTFEVQSSLDGQRWNPNSAAIAIRILPPWYFSPWALVMWAGVSLAAIVGTTLMWFQRQKRRLRRQQEVLENARNRAEAALASELQRTMVLTAASEQQISSTTEPYAKTLENIGGYLSASFGSIYELAGQGHHLILAGEHLSEETAMAGLGTISINEPMVKAVLETGRPFISEDISTDSRLRAVEAPLLAAGLQSLVILRTTDRDQGNGILIVGDHRPRIWAPNDVQLLETVASQIGQTIAHHRLILMEKETKQTLEEARGAAEEANQAKSDFLAKMTHELRTPLNSIIGFTQLLADDQTLSEDHCRTIGIIHASGNHLLETVNGILDMSKIEQGQIELNTEAFSLEKMLEEVVIMMKARSDAAGLTLTAERNRDLPIRIETDKVKLRQVLINFIGNAIKFTETGGIKLRVKALGHAAGVLNSPYTNPVRLRFEIEDTGCGIDEAEIGQLFEKFAQTASGRQSGQGTGLGLPISKSFIELMGGQVRVHSERDQGTIFTFDIVCDALPVEEIVEPEKPAFGESGVPQIAPMNEPFRILVAEDQLPNRILIRTLLTKAGFQVFEAENGKQAIEKCQECRPHLIFMDNDMPLMNGLEATREILSWQVENPPKIIFLSAYAIESYRQEALQAGCVDYLTKPFDKHDLFEVIARHSELKFC